VQRDPRDVENEGLRKQLRDVLARLDTTLAQNAVLLAQNAELISQVAKLNERVAELLPVAKRKARKTKPTAPSEAAPPALTEEQRRAFENRPRPPSKPEPEPKARSAQKPTGRSALPLHLGLDEHSLRPKTCSSCSSTELQVVDVVTEEKLDMVKEHHRRRRVHRTTCRCKKCGARTTARSLPAPYARSKVTCAWLSWLVHHKFVMLTPLDRIRRDLATHGIHMAMGTLVSLIERAADLLAPVDGVHWQLLLQSRWMATDGTGLKVLVPELETAHNGYIELYRNDSLAVFQYEADKATENLLPKLRRFSGVLVADAEHRFNDLYLDGRIIEAGCNAHVRRKFRDAEGAQPILAVEAGAFIGAIYGEVAKTKALGLVGDALREHRQKNIAPLASELCSWMDIVEPTLLPSDPLAAAIRYYKNHKAALQRFIDDPDIPIDNSPTEREFQNVAKLRLNALFAGSTEGAHRACVLLGIAATCRALGISALHYMTWAFERLGTHRDLYGLDVVDVTPAAFLAARP
jgi:transposase